MATELSTVQRAPALAARMADAANRFLDGLSDWQRANATFPFAGEERYFWHYTPVDRNGLLIKHMTKQQRALALALMETGLSERGIRTAHRIIDLEPVLYEHEKRDQSVERWDRSSERYWFSVFGRPGSTEPWGWRVGGHHIAIHITIVDGDLISPLPFFFGANPSMVRFGPETGTRTLPEEEDLARALVQSLDAEQQAIAIVDPVAPADILTKNYRKIAPEMTPVGLALGQMRDPQRELLVSLVRHYVTRCSEELSPQEWARIEEAGLERVTFAWAGPTAQGLGNQHYYNVAGPTFLLEYDNTQDRGNHIHSVWRDFTNDFGEDLLASHLTTHHR